MGKRKIQEWPKMKKALEKQFLPSNYMQSLYKNMHNLRQTSSVDNYNEKFYKLLSKMDLQETEEQQIARYLSGLKPSIQDSFSMYALCTLFEAYSRAIMMERQLARKAMQLQNLGGSRNHVLPASKPLKGNGVNKERSQNSSASGVVFKCYVW